MRRALHRQKRSVILLVLAAALGAVPAAAQVRPGEGSSRPPQFEPPQVLHPVFEFHSGFWLNLHHLLYHQARERIDARTAAVSSPVVLENAADRADWDASLDYYVRELAGRDLLVNGDMVKIKNRLAELEDCTDLAGRSDPRCASGLRPAMVEALERVAPIYRTHWWTQHDRANRAWVAAVAPLLDRLGNPLSEQLAAIYQQGWPSKTMRVDVSYFANWAGAYTTLEPVHITISSGDPRNQGTGALEILFHEASHVLADGVRDGIARECRTRNKPIPRDLWHALLFYTTGEMVRRALIAQESAARADSASPGPPGYKPYAIREGLYARGWQNYLRVLERTWQPYLDGKVDFDRALARLAAAL